jgi:hypothetical protein
MKIDGKCHCGNITYSAEINPDEVILCHCTDCQTLSGCAFRTVVFADEATFQLHGGTPKIYIKTAQSGNLREQSFCPDCGTPIYSTSTDAPPRKMGLRVGAIVQRDALKPKAHYFRRSAQDWVSGIDALPDVE